MDSWKRESKVLRQLLAEMRETSNGFRRKKVINPFSFDERSAQPPREKFAGSDETMNKLRALSADMKENLIRLKQIKF